MIFKINNQDKSKVARLLNENGIEFKSHASEFDAFVAHEINECERVYDGSFGKYTNDIIAKEVEDIMANEEIGFISDVYNDKVTKYARILDQETIATATISNTINLQLKEVKYGWNESFIVVCDKDVYECPVKFSEQDNKYTIKVGELKINTDDFIKTNKYNVSEHGRF